MKSNDMAIETFRQMTPDQRCQTAFALYRTARRIKTAACRAQHPEWSESRVHDEVRKVFLHARS